ncbi:universal stress protein [Natrialbaceae archaeon GCM10025810]|uniref:universal stress protein n=1 Tax=Halovalidus salilacus TaxID=3075124 RepID=UPI003612C9FF
MAIETILLAVGPMDAPRANELAETVIEVAAPLEATVVIGHAFTAGEYEDELREELGFDAPLEEADPDEVAGRRPPAAELRAAFDDAGVAYEVRGVVVDEHSEGIVDLATAVDADRIFVGGRSRSPADTAVLGSTSQEVMLSAPCPVTTIQQDADER